MRQPLVPARRSASAVVSTDSELYIPANRKLNNRHSARRSYEKRRERMQVLARENESLRTAILQMQTLQTARHRLNKPVAHEDEASTPPLNVVSRGAVAVQEVADELADAAVLLSVFEPVEFLNSRARGRAVAAVGGAGRPVATVW